MKKFFSFLLLIAFTCTYVTAQNKLTAEQVLSKTISVISNAKGVEANFKVYHSGYSGAGSVKTSGSLFNVTLPEVEVWYNGKDLYTYNKNTEETTVVIPTEEELAESNPLVYVTGAPKKYSVTYSTVKKNDRYVLELLPKNKNDDIKRITLTLRQSDFVPEKLVVEPKNGSPVSAEISSFKTSVFSKVSDFDYPRSKYPKVEIIDLR